MTGSWLERSLDEARERERRGESEVTVYRNADGTPWYVSEKLLRPVTLPDLKTATKNDG